MRTTIRCHSLGIEPYPPRDGHGLSVIVNDLDLEEFASFLPRWQLDPLLTYIAKLHPEAWDAAVVRMRLDDE